MDIWIAAERLAQFQVVLPDARQEPAIAVPDAYAGRDWSVETALIEILRGRLEGQAPVTATALAEPVGLGSETIASALAALEVEGFAMRGRFTPGAKAEEWCARRLLARIHHYTIKRLRAEIEPVAARDFLRFLFAWQHVTAETRMEGPDALATTVAQLEGFEAPAGAWESEILSARVADYEPAWLDDECLSGRVAWARLKPHIARPVGAERGVSPVRTTPITLLVRRHAAFWHAFSANEDALQPSGRAQAVAAFIREHGASFFDEVVAGTSLLRPQAEEALAELVALGLVASDSFAGLRTLLVPSDRRGSGAGGRRRRRAAVCSMDDAGRWALARRGQVGQRGAGQSATGPHEQQAGAEAVEHTARTLLLRYGVVFWRAVEREADWLPPWRELLRVYRRLETRGEIRGGRFVAGFSGEQFALPDAIGLLRETRRKNGSGQWVSLSGADPLNLVGILTPGPKVAALTGNRLLYRDGLPIGALAGGEMRFYEALDSGTRWQVRKALLRGTTPPVIADLAPA